MQRRATEQPQRAQMSRQHPAGAHEAKDHRTTWGPQEREVARGSKPAHRGGRWQGPVGKEYSSDVTGDGTKTPASRDGETKAEADLEEAEEDFAQWRARMDQIWGYHPSPPYYETADEASRRAHTLRPSAFRAPPGLRAPGSGGC